jgi:hypothetical protein
MLKPLSCILVVLFTVFQAAGVTVRIANGKTFTGNIVFQDETQIKLSIDGHEVEIYKSLIQSIDSTPVVKAPTQESVGKSAALANNAPDSVKKEQSQALPSPQITAPVPRHEISESAKAAPASGITQPAVFPAAVENQKKYAYANISSQTGLDMENPCMNGRGLRIAGFVLLITGGIDLAIGLALDNNNILEDFYSELGENRTGDIYEKCIWIEGAIRSAIALPMLITGYVQLARWNSWEKKHSKKGLKLKFQGARMVMEF